jgi:hypothetical protein
MDLKALSPLLDPVFGQNMELGLCAESLPPGTSPQDRGVTRFAWIVYMLPALRISNPAAACLLFVALRSTAGPNMSHANSHISR